VSDRPTHAFCPVCGEESAIDAERRCLWCRGETVERRRRGGWTRPDLRGSRYTEAQLRALHLAHMRGSSIRSLAKRTYRKAGYRSFRSAELAIGREWRRLGLAARDRIEQVVISSTKHGRAPRRRTSVEDSYYRRWLRERRGWRAIRGPGRPRCKGRRLSYPRKGEPCLRPAMEGSEYCAQHDPARREERLVHMAAMRERAGKEREAAA